VGFFARLPQSRADCSIANAKLFGNLAKAQPLGLESPNLVDIHDSARAPELRTLGPSIPETCIDAFPNKVALQLSHCLDNREQCLTQRAASVDVLLIADELDAERPELLQRQQQMARAASKPVEAPDDDGVELPLTRVRH